MSGSAGAIAAALLAAAPAIVLQDSRTVTNDRKESVLEHRVRLEILSRRGFEHADQMILYEKNSEALRGFYARTLLADGRSIEIPPDLRREVVAWKNESVDVRALYFTFPAVEEGAVLEWRYEIRKNRLQESWPWPVQRDIPVREARFVSRFAADFLPVPWVRIVSRVPLDRWCEEGEPAPAEAGYRRVGEFVCRDVPALEEEPLAPPDADVRFEPRVVHHFLMVPDLSDRIRSRLQEAWTERIERCTRKRSRLAARAREIVAGAANEAAKIDRIHRFVTESLSVRGDDEEEAWVFGKRPCADLDQVLAGGGGSRDEVTMVALVMLQEVGVPARVVLVSDRSEGAHLASLPDPDQYRHPLLEVGRGAATGYLDPSCRYCMAGALDWTHCGEGSGGMRVMAGAAKPEPIGIPGVSAHTNAEIVQQRVTLEPDGAARLVGRVQWQVQADVSVRRALRNLTAAGRERWFLERISGDVEAAKVEVLDPENLRENMRVDFEIRQPALAIPIGDLLVVRAPDLFSRSLQLPMQQDRKLPVWWRYARSVNSRTSFAIPEGAVVVALPEDRRIEGPGLRFEAAWRANAESRKVEWRALLTVARSSVSANDYPAAREFAVALRRALREGMVLRLGEAAASR